jgi:chromosome segregation ATPase
MSSKAGGGSRHSDEDGRTSVKVGMLASLVPSLRSPWTLSQSIDMTLQAVRIRPPLKSTDPGFDLIPQRFQRSMVQVTSTTSLAIESPQGKKLFVFDRVFGPDVRQEGVWEYLYDSVNAFTQGYNVSLLAYGQSGAGKSYTMGTSGPAEQGDAEVMGVIPRAAAVLFDKLEGPTPKAGANSNRGSMSQLRTPARYSAHSSANKAEKNWTLKATYVEIYNEQLRDLLIPENVPAQERSAVSIREDVKGNILLTGLRQVEINSVGDLLDALNFGSTIRQTDSTAINAKSSRSHAVFSLNLVQRKSSAHATKPAEKRFSVPIEAMSGSETFVTTDSKLHFVDLAGSERLKNTGAQGERAKEGISINAGLAALGKVISQLSSRHPGSHVSYRDSRLTRLLQDSLGGNAITYMIACVTPAEFHLSETLNTVQYAQRARAIQSKPRIQQIEEGDKQAIIDRLKAEVAFLREQIRSAERSSGERRTLTAGERSERQIEREAELQNQLLDAQENYSTLSQRHAKLISEMARARNEEQEENHQLEESIGDTATERLNRSNTFAQAVEQVVLEYEKTIQSLEQSLSSTRATLSSTEANLLEKETKNAYTETINTQLQARLQKLMDREANTENYLHGLEAKLDGHSSGEEKNATIALELRKELGRVRENEAAAEDYISTLEERLAEADQDAELMQREIDRLEQVIERQRSLGKLDSLLYELDHIQQDGKSPEADFETANGVNQRIAHARAVANHSRSQSHVSRTSRQDVILESGEEDEVPDSGKVLSIMEEEGEGNGDAEGEPVAEGIDEEQSQDAAQKDGAEETPKPVRNLSSGLKAEEQKYPTSPAQSRFMADKLDTVTQELLGLRVEHESTVHDYEMLNAKYEEALRTLAELQDAADEARHPARPRDSIMSATSATQTRPPSFLSDERSSNDTKDGARYSSSRSLSSELSSAMESPATIEHSDAETTKSETKTIKVRDEQTNGEEISLELARLKTLASEKDEKISQLELQHQEALDLVEELKTEVAKVQAGEAISPRSTGPVIRRKSSQNVMIIDRAHRSFASLRNIATENFENNPDVMQNFELNLHAAMHELHARSERIQELEADVASAKKEMETKMALISGLTRERTSLKASPMDISVVSNLREQLEKNERQLREMQQQHVEREAELQAQLASLRTTAASAADAQREVNGIADASEQQEAHAQRIAELHAELSNWEGKHQAVLDAMEANEQEMKKTIADLEAQVAAAGAGAKDSSEADEASREADAKQQQLIQFLRNEIDEYKAIINSNAATVAEIQQRHAETKAQFEAASQARDGAVSESAAHKDLIAKLESQLSDHELAIKSHQDSLEELRMSHTKEVESIMASSKQDHDAQLDSLRNDHAENIRALEGELTEAREELMKVATQVAFALGLDVSVEKISERIEDLVADQKQLSKEQKKRSELEAHVTELSTINDQVMKDLQTVKTALGNMLKVEGEPLRSPRASIEDQLSAVKKKMDEMEIRSKKNSRLIDELEEQLQSNYDQAQITNNRLSTLQAERNGQLDEATAARLKLQGELDTIKEEYATLQVRLIRLVSPSTGLITDSQIQAKLDGMGGANGTIVPGRSNSITSQLRKSASAASLPSPPPAVPLPPLPSGQAGSPPATSSAANPTPTGLRPASKDLAMNQIHEDQEARIRTIEKHLFAEKQLTNTLEEALTDLERQSNKIKADCEAWRRRATELESEVRELKEKPQNDNRWSLHQVEEERQKREVAEAASRQLQERMNAISKKKKKGSLNCF